MDIDVRLFAPIATLLANSLATYLWFLNRQRLLNSLDEINGNLSSLGESLSKEEAFTSRLKLKTLNAASSSTSASNGDYSEKWEKLDKLEKESASLG